jgi:dynein heavy chain 2
MIIEYAFGEMRDVEIATIHCSSLITPQHVLQKLSQVCISKSSGSGREYIAKNGGRLILYFKDLNLVKPDKWGTCQLVEFLQQVNHLCHL